MRLFSRVILPLLLFIAIAIESFLKMQQSSLCSAKGCALAGELLRFDAMLLYFIGLFGAFLLVTFGFLSLRKPLFEKLFFATLLGALLFEATLFGYQLFTNETPCLFCMGVFATLLLIALLNFGKEAWMPIVGVGAIFVALSTLAITPNKTLFQKEGSYLIYLEKCGHCKALKTFLAKEQIPYQPIKASTPHARFLLKSHGITTVPVWVEKNGSTTTMVVGTEAAKAYLTKKREPIIKESPIEPTTLPSVSNLYKEQSEGCTITITPEPSCDSTTDQGAK